MSRKVRPVAAGVFAGEGDDTRLLAGRRKTDGRLVFPLPTGTRAMQFEMVELGRAGRLWSWTVQRFPPKEPYDGPVGDSFHPYAVGYIELPGELIVESRLVDVGFERLRLGLLMRVTTLAYRIDGDGTDVLTYAFRPAEPA